MGRRSSRSPTAMAAIKDKDYHKKVEFLGVDSMVEVSSDEEGFKGAWYVAKILKLNYKRKGKFLIQYQTLLSEEDPNELLTETVDISFIRPLPPPPAADQTYEMHDVVNAFHRDGWWKGVVSKVEILKEETPSTKYSVVFENPPEIFDFCSENLRFHFEWTDGKWVQPPKQKEIPIITQCEEQSADADTAANHPKVVVLVTNSSAAKHHNGEKSSCKRMRDGTAHSKGEQQNGSKGTASAMEFEDCASKETEISCRMENADADNVAKYHKAVASVTGSSAQKYHNGEKSCKKMRDGVAHSQDKSSVKKSKNNPLDIQKESNASGKKDKVAEISPQDSGKQQNISEGTATEMEFEDCASKAAEVSCRVEDADVIIRTLPIVVDRRAKVGGSCVNDDQAPSTCFGSEEGHVENYHNGEKPSCKRVHDGMAHSKDKSSVKKSKNNPLDIQKESEQKNGSKGTASEMEFPDCASKEAEISYRMENADVMVGTLPIVPIGDHTAKVGGPCGSVDDQALSTCFGSEEGHVENCDQSPAITVQANCEPVKKQEMPFTRSSPLWKNVDSLDVFRFMPQKPHFSPLFKCNEASREGFAIGHMLNFSNLVEKTSNMRGDEPRKVFEDYLEALADLESFGFDVKAVVDRIRKLLSIKTRQEQLNNELEDIRSKITQCDGEKAKVEEEISAIDKKMNKLETKRAMKVSKKVMKDSESNLLRQDANKISEDILNVKLDFESQATAPW